MVTVFPVALRPPAPVLPEAVIGGQEASCYNHAGNKAVAPCDECGRFIAMDDFDRGAMHRLVYPDSEYTRETWETLCCTHGQHTRET